MRFTESQFIRLTRRDKIHLLEIAKREERSPSDIIRRLIRQAARELSDAHAIAERQSNAKQHGGFEHADAT